MTQTAVAVLGTGRVGLTLARALVLSGTAVRLLGRSARAAGPGLPDVESEWGNALGAVRLLLIAVPDDAIADVAQRVTSLGVVGDQHIVLHTSGLHGRSVLAPLTQSGASLGSLHPLQAFSSDVDGGELLRGIPAIVEGDPRAVNVARALAVSLGMGTVLELPASGKVKYHAAAVVASNYLVVLAEMAERLAQEAGAGDGAAALFHPIMERTLARIAAQGSAAALTGPIRRGDIGTVAAHLAVLHGNDRLTYIALGREALQLARRGGLDEGVAGELDALLTAAATDR